MNDIDISGLDKAAVLAALYNNSCQQGLGFLQPSVQIMTRGEAAEILAQGYTSFDYLYGRVMKIDLDSDVVNPRLYDRDLGEGACARVINSVRQGVELS